MSIETKIHFRCDTCGHEETKTPGFGGYTVYPEGWITVSASNHSWAHSYCSEACAREFQDG